MRVLFVACLLAVLVAGPIPAREISVVRGAQELIEEPEGILRLAVGAPSVADVQLFGDKRVLVTGKALGSTSLWIETESGMQEHVVRVRAPRAVENVHRRDLDSQVQIDIKIVETSKRVLRQAGIQAGVSDADGVIQVSPPGLLSAVTRSDADAPFLLQSASGFLPVMQAFNLVYGDREGGGLLGVISVLEAHGLAYVMAEPSLVAMSGQTASFLVGGEFPVPVVQNTSGSSGSVSIEYKEFGVRVNLSPTVLNRDRIALRVAPEVSELDFSNAVQSAGVSVPALRTRRADTSIELGDGESLIIGGLLSRNLSTSVDKVPGLGDIPILGALFKSNRFQRDDRELLMIVSPRLVRPFAKDAELPELPGSDVHDYDPSAAELFFFETGEFEESPTGFWEDR